MNTEIYSLASCPGTKYSGDTITLRSTPRDGIGPYYVAFKKDGIIIDPSRLGGESNPITNAPENVEIIRTYTLNDVDVSNALTGMIDFSVFIRGSCPTGGGLQFDGVNDYVNAGNAASLNLSGNKLSVFALIKTSTPDVSDRIIINKWGVTPSWILMSSAITGKIQGYVKIGGVSKGYTTLLGYADNSWHNIGLVYNGSFVNIYVDGVVADSPVAATGNIDTSVSENVLIGKYTAGSPSWFNGTIDEVRIYNRALSPTEVLNYNGYVPRNGLVLEHIYSLGNANDLSGYGNNGTPINGPVFIPNACMDTCTVAIGCIAPVCNFVVT